MATKFDLGRVQRMLSSEGMNNLNDFLENLPRRASKNLMIATAIAWASMAAAVLYVNILSVSLATLNVDLAKTDALKPIVPEIIEIAVPAAEISPKLEFAKKAFDKLTINIADGRVEIQSTDPKFYGAFMQTMYTTIGLGAGYKVTLTELCEGSGCVESKKAFLSAAFDVKKLELKTPETK